ncbi:hypothetical protein DITRI_Ditri19aG0002000 [Diplodiscus trichospermus]
MEHPDTKVINLSHHTKKINNTEIPENSADEVNDSPIDQVRLTVPIRDDPTLPCLTFRTWALGITSCAVLAFLNQFFHYRQNSLHLSSVTAQIVVLPLEKLMAAYLPHKSLRIPSTKWSFSVNPGPFSLKENVLITIFANTGSTNVYAVNIISIVKAFYHGEIHPLAVMLLAQTTQMLGYGWAGIFQKFLVDSPYMWWPNNLVQVSLFRALHEDEVRSKGRLTRLQFFLVESVTAQIIGTGRGGLGVGSFALAWSTVASFLESPLAAPAFAIINIMVDMGFTCRTIRQQTKSAFQDKFSDVHYRLMKKNYKPVLQWWFYMLLTIVIGLAMLTSEGFGRQFQLPY